jgi:hypothetical protein
MNNRHFIIIIITIIAYARLVLALSQLDISGTSAALRALGYKNSQSDAYPERDVEFFRFLMRDTGSRTAQQEERKSFTTHRRRQRNVDRSGGNSRGRFMASIPPSLIFLFRVLGLIRGLATTLEVKVPYLETLSLYARFALEKEFPRLQRAIKYCTMDEGRAAGSFQSLGRGVSSLVRSLVKNGEAVGVQVRVV